LAKTLFPLGGLTKPQVRELAIKYGLVNATKKESMEICFIPNNDYAKFIEMHASPDDIIKGEVRHEDGTFLTTHDGIHKFTVGQRKGLGFAGGVPLYVTRIDPETGTVWVGGEDFLKKESFSFEGFHLVRPCALEEDFEVKIRYRCQPALGRVQGAQWAKGGLAPVQRGQVRFQFASSQKSVTPGQIAVLYRGDEVMGGGFIHEVESQ
jgi:tRNA-uridine 2-sulfurtransferase